MNDTNKIVVSNEKLKEVLESLGNTPFDEPKIAEAIDEKPLKKSKVVKLALKKSKLKIKDFPANEIAEFYNALVEKITGLTFEDGTYKSTKATENMQLPDFEEHELLLDAGIELENLKAKQKAYMESLTSGNEIEPDKLNSLVDELTTCHDKIDSLVWKVTELNKEDLTSWEQQLVFRQIFDSVADIEKTSVGK
ncbi:hypothetical protein TPMD03_60 [Thiohalocapsa phage LS06-2018-MD03]|nr:hypothetical protein TPMD03_60 [Thiohalocapsa phage LS06-2018-MD03]